MTEWWYFNGKMSTDEGKQFSFDTAIFNVAYKFGEVVMTRPMLHIQVADLDKKQTIGAATLYDKNKGRFSTETLDISIDDDFLLKKVTHNGKPVYLLKASGTEENVKITLELTMEPLMEPFLINKNGLMSMPNNTNTYYYAIPRLKTTGTITINKKVYHVSKVPSETWMDHQWGDFSVEDYGWEWF